MKTYLIAAAVVYAGISFITAEFNPLLWDMNTRGLSLLMAGCSSLVIYVVKNA